MKKYPEVKVDQWEDEAFQILNKVKKDGQSIGIVGFLDFAVRANFGGGKVDLFSVYSGDKLLFSDLVWFGPILIIAVHDSAVQNDPLHFFDDSLRDINWINHKITLFSDELIAFVLGVVMVLEFACGVKLEIEELVTIGSSVTDTKY